MKRKTRKSIMILVVLALGLSTAGVAFAGIETGTGGNISPKTAVGEIILKTVYKDADWAAVPETELNWLGSDYLAGTSYSGYKTDPIPLDKGSIVMYAENDSTSRGEVIFELRRQSPDVLVGNYVLMNPGGGGSMGFNIPDADNYYIRVRSAQGVAADAYKVKRITAAYCAPKADGTTKLKNNEALWFGQIDPGEHIFSFKAINTGYINVESSTDGEIKLCNSSGKALSGYDLCIALNTNGKGSVTYGVKKGVSYIIKVKRGVNTSGIYSIGVVNKKITTKGGSKQSKAVTLKKNTTKKGTIIAGSNAANWYKFKISDKKKHTIDIGGANNKLIKVKIIYKKGKKQKTKTINFRSRHLSHTATFSGKKGYTCYIKVFRGDKESSGWYSLKWE